MMKYVELNQIYYSQKSNKEVAQTRHSFNQFKVQCTRSPQWLDLPQHCVPLLDLLVAGSTGARTESCQDCEQRFATVALQKGRVPLVASEMPFALQKAKYLTLSDIIYT